MYYSSLMIKVNIMDFSDVEHFGTMLSGCESLSKGTTSPDSKYALAVLKMHAADAGFVAGTEGFIDSIKRGASNIKEWILKVIKSIRDFFSKKRKPHKGSVKKSKEEIAKEVKGELPKIQDYLDKLLSKYQGLQEEADGLDIRETLGISVDLSEVIKGIEKSIAFVSANNAEQDGDKIEGALSFQFSKSRKELNKLLDALESKAKDKSDSGSDGKLSSITQLSHKFAKAHDAIENLYDEFVREW